MDSKVLNYLSSIQHNMTPSAAGNDYAYRLDKMCGNMTKKCVK